jgi:glutamate---cysteine ligase / carboxylate-amine ligase
MWSRWPTAGAAEPFGDLATYRAVSEQMIGWGAAMDPGMLYFDVRLSEKYPTVEIRVADVCTDVEDAALLALLARALVDTHASACEAAPWRADLLRVAGWRAARFGLAGDLVHPVAGGLVPVREAVDAAVRHVRPSLEESGDLELVTEKLERLLATGGGAARQRRTFEASEDLRSVVRDLANRTEASWES